MAVEGSLKRLADAMRVATEFWDWKGNHVSVDADVIVDVLAAMDIDASTEESAQKALEEVQLRPWRQTLPPVIVARQGKAKKFEAHLSHGHDAQLRIFLEQGGERGVQQVDNFAEPRDIDGVLTGEASYEIPGDLPLGYHKIVLVSDDREAQATLIVTPDYLHLPEQMGEGRVWGFAAQLYSVRSHDSWGIGDLADLADLATWSATQLGTDYVLVNPLHAAQAIPPMDASPYLPSSRLFLNPMYIRPEMVTEYTLLDESERDQIDMLRGELAEALIGVDLIERDLSWQTKRRALSVIYRAGRRPARQMAFDKFREQQGKRLRDFATWCVLCRAYGNDWRAWPLEFQSPDSPQVDKFTQENADKIEFQEWMQWIAADQLSNAQQGAVDSGMSLGVVTDLAVGVSAASADTWMMSDIYALDISVGAPPDNYNQLGQDWGQPPWRPDKLAETAYEPFRKMVRTALGHSGGVRIDHIIGMFRLWWIPRGDNASRGTYVGYDHEAMIGIIALEAQRAGGIVVGEDLGTVEPWVRGYLESRGILGTSVLWFENGPDGMPKAPEEWRETCMGSVTTHDLAPTAGYLSKAHVKLRHELDLLTESYEHESELADLEIGRWHENLVNRGLLFWDSNDPDENFMLAMHRFLTKTPARVLNVALVDAVGDKRIQNQPGTWWQYPNWRIPLSGPDGKALLLEDVYSMKRPMRIGAVMNGWSKVPEPWG